MLNRAASSSLLAFVFVCLGLTTLHAQSDKPTCDLSRAVTLSLGSKVDGVRGGRECYMPTYRSGSSHEGSIYRFDLPRTTTVEITTSSTDFPPAMSLHSASDWLGYNNDSWYIPTNLRGDGQAKMVFTLQPGTYYVDVHKGQITDPEKKVQLGTRYQFAVREIGAKPAADAGGTCGRDYARLAAKRAPLQFDRTANGEIRTTDCFVFNHYHHFYKLSVAERSNVTLLASSEAFNPEITVYDAAGKEVKGKERDKHTNNTSLEVALDAGDYVVGFSPTLFDDFETGSYKLTAHAVAIPLQVGEQGETCQQADLKALQLGVATAGKLHAGTCIYRTREGEAPAEIYTFKLAAAQEVTVEVDPKGAEPRVIVVTANGGELAQPEKGPGVRRVRVSLPAGDQHVFVLPDEKLKTGTFTITVKPAN